LLLADYALQQSLFSAFTCFDLGGCNPAGDVQGPSLCRAKDRLVPHDGGDTAPDAAEAQGEGGARDAVEDPANVSIDDRSREV
jgi:hypothetical protein